MREWGIVTSVVMLLITSAFGIIGMFMLFDTGSAEKQLVGLGALAFFGSGIPYSLLKLLRATIGKRRIENDTPAAVRVFVKSKGELAALTFMSAGAGLGCYLLPQLDPAKESMRYVGWFGAVFCGLGVCVIPTMAKLRPFRLTLSPHGLDYTLFKVGPIEWRDILSVRTGEALGTEFISLELTDKEKYFARGFPKRGRKPRWLGSGFSSPFVILPLQLGASARSIVDAIDIRLSTFGHRETPA
jgi:hypothetical protein